MTRRLITQLQDKKNRLKITGARLFAYLDAAFCPDRGSYELLPVGACSSKDAWDQFWDVWKTHKADIKAEGIWVKKENGQWTIYYRPPQGSGIVLDESIRGFEVLGHASTSHGK